MLEIRDLTAGYGDVRVLWGVSLSVERGQVVALVGANGMGKTTLLRTVSGVVHPSRGWVRFSGEEIAGLPPYAVAARGIAHVPEGRHLFPLMTVRENLVVGSHLAAARAVRGESLGKVYALFPRLRERQDQLAGSLSGGEQQMLAIARGLMLRPSLLMLDEPSLGLAPLLVDEIFQVVGRLRKEGVAVLLVEQNVQQALRLADRAYVLENGRMAIEGRAAELLDSPHVRRSFLGR